MQETPSKAHVAIACGGTGGHLFPGLAVAGQLIQRGCAVTLLISPKEVDQQAVKDVSGMRIATLPAVGLSRGGRLAFVRGFIQSYRASAKLFKSTPPDAVLAMGGFTSAPPILAGRRRRAATFLHESNVIPGRANRWLAHLVNQAFIGFEAASSRLSCRNIKCTGTPVRYEFTPAGAGACRGKLGLDPQRPVLLVVGGSQGARGVNDLAIGLMPLLAKSAPELQWILLTGNEDSARVEKARVENQIDGMVRPFFAKMELALGAASAAISRAGASSLAELAAMRVPAVLIPYPAATDNHQLFNARVFEQAGAARIAEQKSATPEIVAPMLLEYIRNAAVRDAAQTALARMDAPGAAGLIADTIVKVVMESRPVRGHTATPPHSAIHNHQSALP